MCHEWMWELNITLNLWNKTEHSKENIEIKIHKNIYARQISMEYKIDILKFTNG